MNINQQTAVRRLLLERSAVGPREVGAAEAVERTAGVGTARGGESGPR